MKKIETIIQQLVQEIMELDDVPAVEAHLAKDVGVASIDFVELSVALERAFSISVPEDLFTRHYTIQALSLYVSSQQVASHA